MPPSKTLSTNPTQSNITYVDLLHSWSEFETKILSLLTNLDLADKKLECDHVALRVNSITSANVLRQAFCQVGKIISDNQINGRSILIIELNTPLTLGEFSIPCVELPYPSDKLYPQEGWEHIELVIPSQAKECEALSQDLKRLSPKLTPLLSGKQLATNESIQIKMSSPKGEKECLANPTIAFKFHDVSIKVHPHSIKTVIASERVDTV